MRCETQNSTPDDGEYSEYKRFSEENPIAYDAYVDLSRISKKIFKAVEPAVKTEQEKNYDPKMYGEKRTYPQDWSAYNQAQMKEKTILISILNELLDNIPFPQTKKVGRNPIPTRDKIFYLVMQAYNIKSSRRCISDLELCRRLGFMQKTPHFNTVLKCLKDPTLETYFKHLINVSGLPLQQVETDFAVDSSGFSTSQFDRWFDYKWGKTEGKERRWRKAHITCGVKTNIITAVNITKGTKADSPQFMNLVGNTNKIFDIKEVSADKAYLSRQNIAFVSSIGGVAYIPFKKTSTGRSRGPWVWRRMFDFYTKHREEFMMHYHKRSNVETCFHMLKRKFGNCIRTRNEVSQNNEILAKCLAHNLCVLIQEMLELGIEIDFKKCADIPIAHKLD